MGRCVGVWKGEKMRRHREKPVFDDDERRAMLMKCFRCGLRRPWCRLVWKSAVEVCGGTQDAAARRLFVTTSAVSEGVRHGRLSLDILVVMMCELAPQGWRPPELPSRDEMMDEGLIEAMAFLRDPSKTAAQRRRLCRDDLAVLAALQADQEWPQAMADYHQARATGDAGRLRRAETRQEAIAARVLVAASRRRGVKCNHNAAQLRELGEKWLAPLIECKNAIPFDWG